MKQIVVEETADLQWVAVVRLSEPGVRIETFSISDGRFVVDIEPAALTGSPASHAAAGGELLFRWAQYRSDPATVRLVAEHRPAWTCTSHRRSAEVVVECQRTAVQEGRIGIDGLNAAERPTSDPEYTTAVLASPRGVELGTPLEGFSSSDILERSLEYDPADVVRDGLPHFGSGRDDWLGRPRVHRGIDIYCDSVDVLSMASGTVVGVGSGRRSGGWIKVDHGRGVETVYVHVRRISVEKGESVTAGQTIARIDGAAGNAVQPQLHLEFKIDGEPVDPALFFMDEASLGVFGRWLAAVESIPAREAARARIVNAELGR